jgi:hypothetical protein
MERSLLFSPKDVNNPAAFMQCCKKIRKYKNYGKGKNEEMKLNRKRR